MKELKLPKTYEKETIQYMKAVVSKLTDDGLFEDCDVAALEMLALNYNCFIIAQRQLLDEGVTVVTDRGNVQPHPAIKISKDSQLQALKIMEQFGLTARSRNLVKPTNVTEVNPFALDE